MDDEEILEEKNEQKESKLSQVKDTYDTAKDLKKLQEARTAQNAKVATNAAKAASSSGAGASGIAAAAVEVIAIIVVIIVIILIAVGIATFILAGMGLIWGGISEVVEGVADWWKSITDGEETIVKYDTIEDTMNYLHSMDYDLYGYGFVTRPDESDNMDTASGWKITPNNNPNENPDATDEERSSQGSISVSEDKYKELSKGDSMDNTFRYLQVYAISDNYSKLIKNNNKNFGTAVSSWKNKPNFFEGVVNTFKNLTTSDKAGAWGSGLLSVYYEKAGEAGVRGNDVDDVESAVSGYFNWRIGNFITHDDNTDYFNSASVRIKNGKLVVSSGSTSNIKFRYNLDGWVGRYGMPLEFLLATHIATMAPDLSYRLATSFDTDVEILLQKSDNSTIKGGVVQRSRESIKTTINLKTADELGALTDEDEDNADLVITYDDLEKAYKSAIGDDWKEQVASSFFGINKRQAMQMYKDTKLKSPESCMGPNGDTYTVIYTTNKDSVKNYSSNDVIKEVDNKPFITNNEAYLNSVNRSELIDGDNDNLNKITDVRQTMFALVVKALNNAIEAEDGKYINVENGVEEVDPESVKKEEITGQDIDERGIITGGINKVYPLLKVENADDYWYLCDTNEEPSEVIPVDPIHLSKVGKVNIMGSSPVQLYIRDKINNEIMTKDLVTLDKLAFDNDDNEIKHGYGYKKDSVDEEAFDYNYNDPANTTDIDNDYEYSKFRVEAVPMDEENSISIQDFSVSTFVDILADYDHNNMPYGQGWIANTYSGYPYIRLFDILWDFCSEGASRNIHVACNWDDKKVSIADKSIDNEVEILEHYDEKVDLYYDDEEKHYQTGLDAGFLAWRNWGLANRQTYSVQTINDGELPTNYNYKRYNSDDDNKEIINENNNLYPTKTTNTARDEGDEEKLFKPIKLKTYDVKKTNETVYIWSEDGNESMRSYNKADFKTHIAQYHGRSIDAEAYKPTLDNNDETWNFSFINKSNKEGEEDAHTFITISISTYISDDNDAFSANLSGNDDDGYEVRYKTQNIGDISVKVTLQKINDSDLLKGSGKDLAERCSEADPKVYTECCDICYNYMKEIYKTLDSMTELDMTTYVPYVNRVTDHWYRNVYFTPKALEDYNNTYVSKFNEGKSDDEKIEEEKNIIAVDEKYALETGERWTKYETDDNGDPKLYVIDDDGKIHEDQLLTKSDEGEYVLDEDGVTYRKAKNGEKGEYSVTGSPGDSFRVAKRATDLKSVTSKIWEKDGNGAYSSQKSKVNTGWQILDPDDEDLDEMDPTMKKILTDYKDITLVSSQEYESVEQIEDGVRGETNAKVKKIFSDDYYIYDGSTIRASWIQKAKMDSNSDDPDDYPDKDKEFVAIYGTDGLKGNQLTTTVNQISGKINITRDSLNAFSILKNMKTLDAEYIYHDFKELVVELNYFDKEDLLENAQQVMMFPVAGNDSSNWPIGGVDKYPKYYGTLLHSKADYEVLINDLEVEKKQEKLDLSNTANNSANSKTKYFREGEGSSSKFHKDTFAETARACWEYITTEHDYEYCPPSGKEEKDDKGNSLGVVQYGQVPADKFAYMNDLIFVQWVLYEYGYDNLEAVSVTGATDADGNTVKELKSYDFYGLSSTVEEYDWEKVQIASADDIREKVKSGDIIRMYPNGEHGTVGTKENRVVIVNGVTKDDDGELKVNAFDCSKRINWTLSNRATGVDITDELLLDYTFDVLRIDREPLQYKEVGFEESQPVLAPVSGEVIEYGTIERSNKEWENDDDGNTKDTVGYIKIRILDDTDVSFVEQHIEPNGDGDSASVFLHDNYSKDDLKKLGYDYFEEEYRNAGIAGNVLYIDGFDISEIENAGNSSAAAAANSGYHLGDYTDEDGKVYKDVWLDKNGKIVPSGKTHYVMPSVGQTTTSTPKGTKVSTTQATGTGTTASKYQNLKEYIEKYALNRYSTQYTIPSLSNKKLEFNIKVKEEAKKQAAYAIENNGKLYIKEGAVIGYTYSDSGHSKPRDINFINSSNEIETIENGGSVGNYLRIILRDLDDEVVENVEEYMEKGDNTLKMKITEQFLYWMAFTSEGAEVGSAGTNYYKSENIGDGMGMTGPFGLTYCDDYVGEQLGYKDFAKHRESGNMPLTESEDVFAALMDVERDDVYAGLSNATHYNLLNRTSDYMFLALVDIRHAGPVMLNDQISKFDNQGYLTRKDFQDNWGTASQFQTGLEGRAIRRGILALDELYTAGNKKEGFYEVVWLSKTPWSDFLKNHDVHGTQFGGAAMLLTSYQPNDDFDI